MPEDPEKRLASRQRYERSEKARARQRRYNALPHRKLARQLAELTRTRIRIT